MGFGVCKTAALKLTCIWLSLAFLAAAFPRPATGNPMAPQETGAPDYPMTQTTSSLIGSLIDRLDEPLVQKHIQRLQDFKTRYSYRGDRCYDASEYIASVFSRNGLIVSYDYFTYQGYQMRNVVGQITGTASPDDIFIICSHYDSTAGDKLSWCTAPGADDNGSGTAAVLAAAEILSDYQYNCTIRFIAFCGEEQGLIGSNHYVGTILAANETISGVLNMDMIANNPNPGTNLVNLYKGYNTIVDPTPLINEIINTTVEYEGIGLEIFLAGNLPNSDHQPFARYFQSILLIEKNFSPYYHSVNDLLDRLNLTYCANISQITLATVARMARIIPGDISPPAHTPGWPNSIYAVASPAISIEITDPSPFNVSSLEMRINGSLIAPVLTGMSLGCNVSYVPAIPFSDGQIVNVSVHAEDIWGNGFNHSWEFIVDAVSPEPPTDFTVAASGIQFVKQGLVLNNDQPYDSKHALAPSVMYLGGDYKMWYGAANGTLYHTCYANSADGLNWVKHGAVLLCGAAGQPDSNQATAPTVIYDGEYRMWYTAYNGLTSRIMYANSSDGISWAKQGVAIDNGLIGEPDSYLAYSPTVLKTTEYKMWYTGLDRVRYRILYANSTDGITWTKQDIDATPVGIGAVHGDGIISCPEVAYHNGTYHMFYGRFDGTSTRTIHATSQDGLRWDDLGLAIDIGATGEYDKIKAEQCSIMVNGNGTRAWYSGFDSANWRILFANITTNDPAEDLVLSWTPSASPDIIGYELYRESRPSAFRYPLKRANPEMYGRPNGFTPWAFQTETETNITVFGPVTGSDPGYFYMPEDNLLNLALYLETSSGAWHKLASGTDYAADFASGHIEMYSYLYEEGSTLYACYNHSCGRAMQMKGSSAADVGAGSGSVDDYCYIVVAVDRAGNRAHCADMAIKIGTPVSASWNLLCNPFLAGPVPVSDALAGLEWTHARTWDPDKCPSHWTSNMPARTQSLNTLQNISGSDGIWVKSTAAGSFSAMGCLENVSINLKAGWNLVSYPFTEIKSVSDALAGIPWDRVEIHSPESPTLLLELGSGDPLHPGQGFWVHVTSDSVWNAVNTP